MEEIYELLRAAWCESENQDSSIEAWRDIIMAGDGDVFALLREFIATFTRNVEMREEYDFWLCVVHSTSDLAEKFDALEIPFRGGGDAANVTTRVLIACGLVAAKALRDQAGCRPRVSEELLRFLNFYCGDEPKHVPCPAWALPAEMHFDGPGGGFSPKF